MTDQLPPPGAPSAHGPGATPDRAAANGAALDRVALDLGTAAGEAVQGAALPPPFPGVGSVPRGARRRAAEVPAQVKAQARKLVSLAFAQAWEQPLPVATEQLLAAALLDAADDDEIRERLKSLGGMAATAAAARAARWARRFPAGRILLVATTAMEVAAAARRGSKEIKAVGSYLLWQARAAGVEVDRDRWERATMELVLKPGAHPSLDVGVPTLVTKLAASWTYRAVVPFGDRKAPKKAQSMARGAAQFRVQHLRRP